MSDARNLKLALQFEASGQAQAAAAVKGLAADVRQLGKEFNDAAPAATALANQIEQTARQQGLVTQFKATAAALRTQTQNTEQARAALVGIARDLDGAKRQAAAAAVEVERLNRTAAATSGDLGQAKAQYAALKAELKGLETASKAAARTQEQTAAAFAKARSAYTTARAATGMEFDPAARARLEETRAAYLALRKELRAAEADATAAGRAVAAGTAAWQGAGARVAELKAALEAERTAVRAATAEQKAADRAVTDLGRQYEIAQREVKKLATEQEAIRGRMAAVKREMDAQGVSTSGLSAEQKRLAAAMADAKAKAAALGAAVEQAKTKQQAAAEAARMQTVAEAQAAAAAKQHADSIAAAWQGLGVRSTAEVRSEIAKLQAQFGLLRTAGVASANDIARAQVALRQRVKELEGQIKEVTFSSRAMNAVMNGGLLSSLPGFAALTATAYAVKEAVGAVVTAGLSAERINRSAGAVFGPNAGREMEFVRAEAERLGLDLEKASQAYIKLGASTRNTGIEGVRTREVFTSVSQAAAVLGLSADTTNNAFLALSQMASKGTVAMEEIRGQLGEAIPGALEAMARGLGITSGALIKLVESGQLTADVALPALAKGLDELYKTAADADTAQKAFGNLSTAVYELKAAVADSGALDLVASLARGLTDVAKAQKALIELDFVSFMSSSGYGLAKLVPDSSPLSGVAKAALLEQQMLKKNAAERIRLEDEVKKKSEVAKAESVAAEKKAEEERAETAKRIAKEIEEDKKKLAEAEKRLDQEVKDSAVQAAREVLEGKKRAFEEELAARERTLQEGVEKERDLIEKAKQLRAQAAQQALSDEDRLRAIKRKGMSETQQQADIELQIAQKLKAARDVQAKDPEQAQALAGQAQGLAESLSDPKKAATLFEQASRQVQASIAAQAQAADRGAAEQARANQKASKAVDEQKAKIAELEAELKKLETPKTVTLQAEVEQAKAKLAELQAQYDALQDKTVTVTVNTQASTGQTPAPAGLSTGGRLAGYSRRDSIPALLSPGEWVIRSDRARLADPLLRAINNGPERDVRALLTQVGLRGYSAGGLVAPAIPMPGYRLPDVPIHLSSGGQAAAPAAGAVDVLRIEMGGRSIEARPASVARALVEELARAARTR